MCFSGVINIEFCRICSACSGMCVCAHAHSIEFSTLTFQAHVTMRVPYFQEEKCSRDHVLQYYMQYTETEREREAPRTHCDKLWFSTICMEYFLSLLFDSISEKRPHLHAHSNTYTYIETSLCHAHKYKYRILNAVTKMTCISIRKRVIMSLLYAHSVCVVLRCRIYLHSIFKLSLQCNAK